MSRNEYHAQSVLPTEPVRPQVTGTTPLPVPYIPNVSLSRVIGLLEVLENEGSLELFDLTQRVNLELTQLLLVVKAAEVLGWITTPGGRVELAPPGRTFLAADVNKRKHILNATLRPIFVFNFIVQLLEKSPRHEVEESVVLRQLALSFPQEPPLRILRTVVPRARHAALFKNNSTRRVFHGLHSASSAASPPDFAPKSSS